MNVFWQITILESLQNTALLSIAVIAFGLVRQSAMRLWPKASSADAAVGVLFGVATAATMLLPLHVGGGAMTGCTTVLLSLAGFVSGPTAALISVTLAIVPDALSDVAPNTVNWLGITLSITAAATGLGFRYFLASSSDRWQTTYAYLPVLGAACAITGLCVLAAFEEWAVVSTSAVATLLVRTAAITALGVLLLREIRRYQAETELRKSEARLALQASDLLVQAHELIAARDAAELASNAKSAFLANMSHELRTPLNAIMGFSKLMETEIFGPLGSPRYLSYVNDIYTSGEHLLDLINDILDVAKIESGKMEIARRRIDVAATIESSLRLVTENARDKKQELSIVVTPGIPPFFVDARAIKQILINITSNAVKFTPPHGKISVRATPSQDGGVHIVCEDNGRGIAPDALEKIFVPFSQIDNRFDRQEGGTGLGLSLCKGLVELHGGRMWLESKLGEGCSVHIVLPPEPAELQSSAA